MPQYEPMQWMRRDVLRTGLIGAAGLSAAALLAACGARSSGGASSAGGSADAGTDSGAEIPVLQVALPGSLSNLYPGQEAGILNYYVAAICMEGLISVDPTGSIVPALASAVERPDARTFVYTLREDATFGDGSAVTVQDILYSIERAADPTNSPSTASYWADLDDAVASGTNQITLTSKSGAESFAWLPSTMAGLWVAPKSAWVAADGQIGTSSALLTGSGPYRVTEFAPDSHVEFERVDTWWGTTPKVATIRIDFIPDDNTRLLAWQAGEADFTLNVPLTAATQWEAAPQTRVVYIPDQSYVGLEFNTTQAPFDDPHARKAVAYAINREAIVSDILRGKGQVATALSTPEQFGGLWSADEATEQLATVPQYEYDLDKAKAELAQSATPTGFSVDLTYPNTGAHLGTAALAFAADLAKIGITLNVKEVTIEQWLAAAGAPVAFSWYFNTTGDPGELISWYLAAGNPVGYTDKDVFSTVEQADTTQDPAERAALLIKAQSAQADDLAYAPLWWGQTAIALTDGFGISDFTSYTLLTAWPSAFYATA